MKTTKLFFMAALALTFAACSNDDNDIQNPAEQAAKAEGIPFTATISVANSAATRALKEGTGADAGKIIATWADNEEVALIYDAGGTPTKTPAKVTKQTDGTATISATLASGATNGSDVTIIYPATAADGATGNVKSDLLLAQNGELTGTGSIAEKYDVRKGTGKLSINGGKATVNNGTAGTNVSLTNQFAIMKLTLANNAKNLCIMADNITIAGATLASEGKEFTVAVPAVSSKTVTIVANDASNNCYYFSKAGVSLAAGTYYQSSPTMTALDGDNSKSLYKITATSGVTIPAGKTVVLSGVTISDGQIACEGSVTMILMGANTVTATNGKAAIKIGDSGTTLTITGSGSLTAQGGSNGAGIGTDSYNTTNGTLSVGNIVINGGTVTATGGTYGAGIGTGQVLSKNGSTSITCGDITINGGTVTAQGGSNGAGIGTGMSSKTKGSPSNRCGNITIGTGVISVTATKGNGSPNSIGKGYAQNGCTQTCGTITFGATQVFDGSAWSPDPMVAGTYGGLNLVISKKNVDGDTWTLTPAE